MKGELQEALGLTEHMRVLANETNNLDGVRLSADLQAFLLGVMDESYVEGAALIQTSQTKSLESFFGSQYSLGQHWG